MTELPRAADFYERIIHACFTRRANNATPLCDIKREAALILRSEEIRSGLMPVFDRMVAEGRLDMVDWEKKLYRRRLGRE